MVSCSAAVDCVVGIISCYGGDCFTLVQFNESFAQKYCGVRNDSFLGKEERWGCGFTRIPDQVIGDSRRSLGMTFG